MFISEIETVEILINKADANSLSLYQPCVALERQCRTDETNGRSPIARKCTLVCRVVSFVRFMGSVHFDAAPFCCNKTAYTIVYAVLSPLYI